MQKIKLINLIAVLFGIFLLGACEYAVIPPDAPIPPPPPGDSTSFSLKVQPIFNSDKCLTCHSGTQAPDLRAGRSYQSLMDNNMVVKFNSAESVLYQKIIPGGSMYQYCPSADAATIKYWIDEGAKNN